MSKGTITDDSRIRAAVPTLLHLANRGANVIVMSHLGRPKGVEPELSLRPVSSQLAHALEREVQFAADCVGEPAQTAVDNLHDGQVLLLENVRFHPEDEADDPDFARRLAALGQLYVNDAFGASHRAHASVVGVAAYLPAYAGELMEAELKALHQALDNPQRPMIAVVGGAKVSTKVGVLRNLLKKVDALIIGGAMANTFFKAQGYPTGSGLVEDSALEEAREVADQAGAQAAASGRSRLRAPDGGWAAVAHHGRRQGGTRLDGARHRAQVSGAFTPKDCAAPAPSSGMGPWGYPRSAISAMGQGRSARRSQPPAVTRWSVGAIRSRPSNPLG